MTTTNVKLVTKSEKTELCFDTLNIYEAFTWDSTEWLLIKLDADHALVLNGSSKTSEPGQVILRNEPRKESTVRRVTKLTIIGEIEP